MSGEDQPETLTIRIRDQDGQETFFKIKKTTKMRKVFENYATRKGVQISSLRFLLDGEIVDNDTTPKMLELEDQDQIDCMLAQTGGSL
ncbi:small ubiquitin-related modifier [Fistulifera solaris]|uniref:Small ubiquitin-related modifier n=1 Tax=Fistulifera solaris TaxID=1519565 RepID=A0A1Z5KQB8_FISSO|nr:small ubiquitin-related modifier [Fistulifera solaris]|eukprot:GAX28315.1 small ubiquitin-related modifier [Fistulifera solaris]